MTQMLVGVQALYIDKLNERIYSGEVEGMFVVSAAELYKSMELQNELLSKMSVNNVQAQGIFMVCNMCNVNMHSAQQRQVHNASRTHLEKLARTCSF